MRFFLGTHKPVWLARTDVPLFISARRLRDYKTLPRALGPWALDSGGFTELSMYGEWRTTAMQYAMEARHWQAEIGGMQWAAIQDWMCEPFILEKTRCEVGEHQRATIASYHLLRQLAPEVPWVPVLQGWEHDDYLRHVDAYARAGVDLAALPLVGLGSVCRRQDTAMAEELAAELHGIGIRLHGFGFKVDGLRRSARYFASADSMAWSKAARGRRMVPACTHNTCANCLPWALTWRRLSVLPAIQAGERRTDRSMFAGVA